MTNLNVRIDERLKNDVEMILGQLGLSISDAVRIYFSQIRNKQGIPFELKVFDEPTAETLKIIADAEKDLKSGNISKGYDDVDSLISDLMKE